ncbi:hypothetical protein [Sphingomonas cavernae]|uniref:Flagellar protein FliT n=1 Tax=Sphingomonas cavernae TaxID=2320861 RepID=A0A418WPS8_9SPHN|nr:hypothetical protein [Sphingomonas cavernae]RJF93233.1 hypothetical protein D3876_02420 [Sphingomonas cavernae]
MTAELEDMVDGIERLISALDGRDPQAIELANTALTLAVGRLRGLGGWRDDSAELAMLDHALGLAEAARVRVNLLGDMAERKLDLLQQARAEAQNAAVYGRKGRRSSTAR